MLLEVSRFLQETGMPETVLGRKFNGDHRLVKDLRNGRELRPRTQEKLRKFMQDYKEAKNGNGN